VRRVGTEQYRIACSGLHHVCMTFAISTDLPGDRRRFVIRAGVRYLLRGILCIL
jgi:hypothetical protein